MSTPLTIASLIRHPDRHHGWTEIVSRREMLKGQLPEWFRDHRWPGA
jgi:hypothetical protein